MYALRTYFYNWNHSYHPHGLNERFSFIWSLHSFWFCPAYVDKSGDFSPFHSAIVYVHPPPTYLPIFESNYHAFVVSLTRLAYFLSHDYLSYINSLGFLFSVSLWPRLTALTKDQRYSAYAAHHVYFYHTAGVHCMCPAMQWLQSWCNRRYFSNQFINSNHAQRYFKSYSKVHNDCVKRTFEAVWRWEHFC